MNRCCSGFMLLLVMSTPLMAAFGGALSFGASHPTDQKDLTTELESRYGVTLDKTGLFSGAYLFYQHEALFLALDSVSSFSYYNKNYERSVSGSSAMEKGSISEDGEYGGFNLGYVLALDEEYKIIPALILGYGRMVVTDTPIQTGLLLSGEDQADRTAEQGGMVTGAKLLGQYRMNLTNSSDHRAGLIFGFTLGYQQWLLPSGWSTNHGNLTGLPKATFSGVNIGVSIGGFGWDDY